MLFSFHDRIYVLISFVATDLSSNNVKPSKLPTLLPPPPLPTYPLLQMKIPKPIQDHLPLHLVVFDVKVLPLLENLERILTENAILLLLVVEGNIQIHLPVVAGMKMMIAGIRIVEGN